MDGSAFDRLTRAVVATTTRRHLLSLLASLPVAGAWQTLLPSPGTAKRRAHPHPGNHHQAHHHQTAATHHREAQSAGHKHKKKKKKHGCTPESAAQTCAGRCGSVQNNCGQAVDCGSCTCGGCQICQTCDTATVQCVPNTAVVGQSCGGPGQVCQAGGACTCDAAVCSSRGQICGGGDEAGVCGCQRNDQACGGQICGAVTNNCGQTVTCTGCGGCCDGVTCQPGNEDGACGAGGNACTICPPGIPHCFKGKCSQCGDASHCPANQLCVNGTCRPCDVCASAAACPYQSVQAAVQDVNGPEFIRICPGTYPGAITIPRAVRLYGGGDGTGATDTILDGGNGGETVITIEPDRTVTLERLRITGGATTTVNGQPAGGGGIYSQAARLTITDCTIVGNTGADGGGLYLIGASDTPPFTVEMTRCTVSNNTAVRINGQGGGIFEAGGELLLRQCDVSGNFATSGGGIYAWDPFTAQGTRVSGNHANSLGGGIFAVVSATLDGSQVTGNTAGGGQSGGGIFNSNAKGVIHLLHGSTVSGNTPDDCVHPDGSAACATG